MYHPDLQQLVQNLQQNENGVAQDRLLLYEIYRNLLSHQEANVRFQDMFIKFTKPYHDALMQRYDHAQDIQISQAKRNLIRTWEALQFYLDLISIKDSADSHTKRNKLNQLHKAIEDGIFNVSLNDYEIEQIKNIADLYIDNKDEINGSEIKVNSDYENIIDLFDTLK